MFESLSFTMLFRLQVCHEYTNRQRMGALLLLEIHPRACLSLQRAPKCSKIELWALESAG